MTLPAPEDRVLFVASRARERLDRARGFLSAHRAPGSAWWVVAPTRRAADVFMHASVEDAWVGVHRYGWAQWARALLPHPAPPPASGLMRQAFAARAAREALAEDELEHFAAVASLPGFVRCLLHTRADLEHHQVDASALADLGPVGRDLARLLERLDALEQAHEVAGPGRSFRDAAVPDAPPAGLVLLDVWPETPLERAFLARVVAAVPRVFATCDREDLELAQLLGADVEAAEPAVETQLDRVRSRVFIRAEDPQRPQPTDGSFTTRSCRSEAQEAIEVARAALERARAGVPFDRMGIILAAPSLHQPLLEDALGRASIPPFFTRGTRRPNPGGRALLALLACADEHLSASRFAEYLSFSQVPDAAARPEEASAAWVPAASEDVQLAFTFTRERESSDDRPGQDLQVPLRWEQWLVDAAVIGTHERWQRRLAGLVRELESQLEREPDPTRRDRISARLASVHGLSAFALPLVERLAGLSSPRPWAAWLDELDELAVAALRDAVDVRRTLAELRPLEGGAPIALAEVRQALLEPLSTLRTEPPSEPYGAIWIGTPEEALGRSFDTVFVPGLSEGVFPRAPREDPLLPDALRERLDAELPERPRSRRRQQRAFRAALGAAERHFFATTSRLRGAQAKAQVPSQYLLEAARCAEGHLEAVRTLVRPAPDRRGFGLGFEVPNAPAASIDETEYDVAMVGAIEASEPKARAGAAAYLLAEPTLQRSLRRRGARWRARFGAFDGGVIASRQSAWAQAYPEGLRDLVTSPTALQAFAACPYRFWLYGLLRLRDEDEPLGPERLDPRTRGSMFHGIQFRYVRACREDGTSPAEELERLDAIWADVVARYREDIAPAIDAIYDREVARMRTDLRGWWRRRSESRDGFEPLFAELSFGLEAADPESRDPASQPTPVRIADGYPVRGSVDLVEEDGSGQLRVLDYKTGRPPDEPPVAIGYGETLQPLIYALAVEAMTGRSVVEGRLVYATLRHGYRADAVPATERDALTRVLSHLDAHMRRGFFPAYPREGACRFCDYRNACGHHEETRARGKSGEGLEALQAIRETR